LPFEIAVIVRLPVMDDSDAGCKALDEWLTLVVNAFPDQPGT